MRTFAVLYCSLISVFGFAQKVNIIGQVIDESEDQPLPFSQVAIFKTNADGPAVEGTTSDEDGRFSLSVEKQSNLELRVVFIGYTTEVIPLNFKNDQNINIGRVFMQAASGELGAVEVEGKRAFMTTNLDKRVFDVSQNIVSEGGTAEDALQNIPSVSVDMDGGISLRGSSDVTIWINGKP
ncbi:MAG: carboxypeptidase-like regulatory domain-containing protein, partial [Cryomorphaceae bacterium]|nr:carboxypeptidase-like regulatory domain-containing protein [Cryomorphaceae bacterium]